jgi:hypothetical protein
MAETVSGGAYATPEGKWINAEGQAVAQGIVSAAIALSAERAAALAEVERQKQAQEAARNPAVQAITAALASKGKSKE